MKGLEMMLPHFQKDNFWLFCLCHLQSLAEIPQLCE